MKQYLLQRFVTSVLFLAVCSFTWAYNFVVNGLYFTITNYNENRVSVGGEGDYSGSLVIPSTVMYDGKQYTVTEIRSFGGTGITSVSIPHTVTQIGTYAFGWCKNLTSVTIPNSVTSIGYGAFYECSGLQSVAIPNSVTYIESSAFGCCTSLASIIIPNSVDEIRESAFSGCTGLQKVTISNGVKSIGKYAFSGCISLTSITIPHSITSIGGRAFGGCEELKSVILNSNYIASILYSPYYHNIEEIYGSYVEKFIFGNDVTSIGNYFFNGCSTLKSVTIPNSVTSIGEGAFRDCSGLTAIDIPNSVASIGDGVFNGCTGLTAIDIPNSVTSIGEDAFSSCSGLTAINIPNSVTSIGGGTFAHCTNLTSVNLPNSVTSIGNYAFNECYSLTSFTISNNVTNLGIGAFYYCRNLESITLGKNITNIGDEAFWYCSNLNEITCLAEKTPQASNAFGGNIYDITLHVPVSSIEAYKSTAPWSYFKTILPIDENYSQTPVQSVSELVNAQVYTAETKRAAWYIPAGSTQMETTEYPTFVYKNSTSSNQQFAFIQHNDKYYIYCVGEGKILNGRTSNTPNRGVLVTEDCQPVTITETGDTDYPLFFSYGTSFNINVGGDNQITIDGWSTFDDGNKVALRPVQGVMLDDSEIIRIIGYIDGENIIDEHYSQTPVQSVEELVNNRQVYTAETKRAAWYIPAGSTQMETTEYPTFVYKNSTSSNQQFAFIKHDSKYHIYCVGEGKILNGMTSNTPNRGVLVTEDCQPVTITETGDTEYPLFFSYGSSFNINVGGDNQITIDYWSTLDDGNKVALRPVQGVTLADKDLRRIIGYIDGCIVGDSNGNNEVEIGDVTSVLTLMATPGATGYDNKAADANQNGEIEIGDVTTILTIMAGN